MFSEKMHILFVFSELIGVTMIVPSSRPITVPEKGIVIFSKHVIVHFWMSQRSYFVKVFWDVPEHQSRIFYEK